MTDLKKVLLNRDGMSPTDADMEIASLRYRVSCGENPETILFEEYRLEPDYIFDLL
jgi:hypothetical protein